jgi:hypothetical protein
MYTYMTGKMYILDLFQGKRKINKITSVAEDFLFYFLKHPKSSTYRIHQYIESDYKEKGRTINYKNVYERVQMLLDNGLIVEVKGKEGEYNKHGAILFEITHFGIFYLFLNNLHRTDKDIILKYKSNPLFKVFLFPYVEIKTIDQLTDPKTIELIFDYLHRCSVKVDNYLDRLIEISNDRGEWVHVGFTAPLFDEDYSKQNQSEMNFLEKVKKNLGTKWPKSAQDAKIEVIEKNKKVRLSDGTTELLLEIHEVEQRAILSLNKKPIKEFQIKPDYRGEGHQLSVLNHLSVNEFLNKYDFFDKDIEKIDTDEELKILYPFAFFWKYPNKNALKLGYNILEEIDLLIEDKVSYNQLHLIPNPAINLLSNDKKFMNLLQRVKNSFDNQYKLFMNSKQ